MGRMVRKQVYITIDQDRLLKRRAKALGVPEAEVVRRGIDLAGHGAGRLPLSDRAWNDELRFIRKRGRIRALGRSRGWSREELYDERLARLSR